MHLRAAAISGAALLALSGCAETPTAIPVSASAGPGAQVLSAFDAGVIFADACLIRGPNFKGAAEGLRPHGFTQNAGTGTYFHNRANLSVKVRPAECSMVYGSKGPVDATVSGFAKGTASLAPNPPRNITVTSRVEADGLRYFRVGIKPPVILGQAP